MGEISWRDTCGSFDLVDRVIPYALCGYFCGLRRRGIWSVLSGRCLVHPGRRRLFRSAVVLASGYDGGISRSIFLSQGVFRTDFTGDLKRFDVPTLVLHGDGDQIVPITDSALISSKMIKGAKSVVYKGVPYGMGTTEQDRVNAELLSFIKG